MPTRPVRPPITPPIAPPIAGNLKPIVLPDATIELQNVEWFRPLTPDIKLKPGTRAPEPLRIPVVAANRVLRGIVHLVADIAVTSPPDVVWSQGADELRVFVDRTVLTCATGFVTVSLFVQCEELREVQRMDVAFAVGSKGKPTGLLMSTFTRVQGPALIADTWSDALSAFAWEALITTAQQLAGGVGKDAQGRPLVPGAIAAERDLLLIDAMARNTLGQGG